MSRELCRWIPGWATKVGLGVGAAPSSQSPALDRGKEAPGDFSGSFSFAEFAPYKNP